MDQYGTCIGIRSILVPTYNYPLYHVFSVTPVLSLSFLRRRHTCTCTCTSLCCKLQVIDNRGSECICGRRGTCTHIANLQNCTCIYTYWSSDPFQSVHVYCMHRWAYIVHVHMQDDDAAELDASLRCSAIIPYTCIFYTLSTKLYSGSPIHVQCPTTA